MPPKKQTAKAVKAELKKQDTIQAEEIVAMLKLDMGKSDNDSVVKKPAVKKPNIPAPSDAVKKRAAQDESTGSKSKRAKETVEGKASTANAKVGPTKTTSNRIDVTDGGQLADSDITKGVKTSSKSSMGKNLNEKPPPKIRTSHGSGYQYEIDCGQVADSIDVKDLQKHLKAHLKVDGKKNNLGSTVSILCEGHKVILKSKTFLPKKSLRFLSKKFLKKNWNIRVLSKNAHAYEYKYVGAP